jgi:GT2 family glycosyltransferase
MTEAPVATLRPGLTVSIVTYRSGLQMLAGTLRALGIAMTALLRAQPALLLRVIVIDNSCEARYAAQLALVLERAATAVPCPIEVLTNGRNTGFGAGHNLALPLVDTSCWLVLNPDAELAPAALAEALPVLQADPAVVLLGPDGRAVDGTPLFLCKAYPSVSVLLLRTVAPQWLRYWQRERLAAYERHDLGAELAPVVAVSGACMLLRTVSMRAVGGFDPGYFLYFEDYDLSLRLARQGAVRYCPALRLVHHGGHAARKGWRHRWWLLQSAWRFFHRHGWRWS